MASNLIWRGEFDSLHEAQRALRVQEVGTLFSHEEWLRRQSELWFDVVDSAATFGQVSRERPTRLPLLLAAAGPSRVIDFGGGSAWTMQSSMRAGAQIVTYEVVELEAVVEAFKSRSTEVLTWSTLERSLKEVSPVQFLYTNSALQYLPDNSDVIKLTRARKPGYVLVDELLWSPGSRDWFTHQVNSDRHLVARFTAVDTLTNDFRSIGYSLAWSQLGGSGEGWGFPDMSEFTELRRITGRASMLFVRHL